MSNARDLSDRLAQLLRREHAALGDFLVALAEFDRTRAWIELGYPNLFQYLHRELGLSAGAAFQRKVAAGLLQRFPGVEPAIRDGRLCMSSVIELAKVLTPGNEAEVLPRFFHLSAREAREVVAELAPREEGPARTVVTAIEVLHRPRQTLALLTSEVAPTHPVRIVEQAPTVEASTSNAASTQPATSISAARPATSPPDDFEPLTADLRRLHVTVSTRLLGKLEAARDGLAHAIPGATTEQVLEAALDSLLAKQAARRGLVQRPRAAPTPASTPTSTPAPSPTRRIPTHVRREVWLRDGGKCQWVLESGGICGATRFLELDHVVPVARGGPTTVANLRVLCRSHNQLHARRTYGDAVVDRYAASR